MIEALLLAMLVGAFVGLFYSWGEWRSQLRSGRSLGWRRAAVSIGLFLVTLQAILFVALFFLISHPGLLLKGMYADFAFMLLAVPCTLFWQGTARWCLLASALFLPVVCFFAIWAVTAS
jgi:hypothetical protein